MSDDSEDAMFDALAVAWEAALDQKLDADVGHVIWTIGRLLDRHRPGILDDVIASHHGDPL